MGEATRTRAMQVPPRAAGAHPPPAAAPLAADQSVDLPGDGWAGVVAAAPILGSRPRPAVRPDPPRG